MSELEQHLPLIYIKINGTIDKSISQAILELTVESSLYLPDVMVLSLSDPDLKWADDSKSLIPGAEVVVSAKVGQESTIFDGEIVEVEQVLEAGQKKLIVRAFDRLHRLAYIHNTRTFINAKDSDVLTKLIQEARLTPQVASTATVFDYIIQSNQTNLEFLRQRAASVGLLFYAEGKTIHCAEPEDPSSPIVKLTWGLELAEFRPRISTSQQVQKVTARGWDPIAKKEVIGVAQSESSVGPHNGVTKSGGAMVKSAYNLTAELLVVDRPIRSQDVAKNLATAVADQRASSFIEAEGVCAGDPKIVAGVAIEIDKVGQKFNGKYFVTSAVHTFNPGEYTTRFVASGLHPLTLLSLIAPADEVSIPEGLVIGVVTDQEDPQGLGRVKVKYPWLGENIVSDWARVVSVGGGPDRGVMFLPEVNDEVLVGFEMGDPHHAYVIGGLWNGKDKPPLAKAKAVGGGKVNRRTIKTRTGHEILFEEEQGSAEQITIKTSKGRLIRLSDTDKLIEIKSEQHLIKLDDQGRLVQIDSAGDLKMTAKGKVEITATSGMELKSSASMTVEATASMDVKANASLSLQGSASTELKSSGILTVQGSLVKIN